MNTDQAIDIVSIIISAVLSVFGTTGLFLLIIFLFPEKIEKWASFLWGLIEKTGILYRKANKSKIKYSIQGSVSSFAKNLSQELPDFDPPNAKIEWIDQASDRKAFIDNGKAIIRLRRNDPDKENIATACMLYVSQILLHKAGRYLSPTQREAVELFLGYKMLEREAGQVFDVFVDKWLYPGIEKKNEKISKYFDRFRIIDESAFFVPVFLQEIIYAGDKVYTRKRDDSILHEVDNALEFLEELASRRIGERSNRPYFEGVVCCFAIMIVGYITNITEERYDIYLNHIHDRLLPIGVETVYLVGPVKNIAFICELSRRVSDEFDNIFHRNYDVNLIDPDGNKFKTKNYLLVLRRKTRKRYIS